MSWIARLLTAAALSALLAAAPALARDHWVSARDGAPGGGAADGSAAAPWPDVAAALAAAEGGDRILLAPGAHGALSVGGHAFAPPVTITSAPGGRAHLDEIAIGDAAGLVIRDLDVWPASDARPKPAVVTVWSPARDIVLDGLDIRSTEGALDYYSWDWPTWKAHAVKGVQIEGQDITLSNSTVTGGATALGLKGARARITGNDIRGFSKDGIRVFGAGTVIAGNTIRDCVDVSGNHDDGIQSWARRGNAPDEIVDVTIEANRILEWTGPSDHPLRCKLQGIGLFNGPYRNWTIRNNLIVVRPAHGIALGTVMESRVVNNTVVNSEGQTGRKPWIQATPGTLENGTVVANNVANGYRLMGSLGADVRRANVEVRYPFRMFADPARGDYRPGADSPLLDNADPAVSPAADIEGTARPQGGGPDHGALERHGE